jgi:membrane-associated phospholipid phosphatase
MMRHAFIVSILLTLPIHVAAEKNPFKWSEAHQHTAVVLSDVTVFTNLGIQLIEDWRAPNRRHEIACHLLRLVVVSAITRSVKAATHRERPDHSGDDSFWSGHSSQAFSSTQWMHGVSFSLATSTAYLRTAGNKHYISDVVVGAGVGLAFKQWMPGPC